MPIDEAYFIWLYSHVGSVETKNRSRTYWKLLQLLHNKEFTWDPKRIDKDGNRAQYGKNLRHQFLDASGLDPGQSNWLTRGCSFLELLVALAWELEFEGGESQTYWFWVLIGNLGLYDCTDANPPDERTVEHILNVVIDRTYARNGA